MRKYENVDIIAALGAVMEINTEFYKSDFEYDKEMFLRAATAPNGRNEHLLWLSRSSGTECFRERDVYLQDIYPHNAWCYYADNRDSICAYAVHVTGMEDGKVMGDLFKLDYPSHVDQVRKYSLPTTHVDMRFENGHEGRYPFSEYSKNVSELLAEHGRISTCRFFPENEDDLNRILKNVRAERQGFTPSVFKVRLDNEKPSIEKQLKEKKEQVKAIPQKAAHSEMER